LAWVNSSISAIRCAVRHLSAEIPISRHPV
jgi:hypothetical protein